MLLAMLAAAAVAAPAPDLRQPIAPEAFSEAAFRTHVQTLASDAFEGRAPGTEGETKTVAYLTKAFADAGLEPGGDLQANGKRAWTQRVPLRRSKIVGDSSVTLRAGGETVRWTQGEEIAIRGALTGKDQVGIANAPVLFAGYGVSAPERGWDDFKDVDVRGKVLIVLMNDPDCETGQGAFDGKAMTWFGRSTYKYEEAARRGALGVLLVHEDPAVGYGWATTRNSNTAEVFDIDASHPEQTRPTLEAWIQQAAATDLMAESGLDLQALKTAAQKADFRPVTLPGVTLSTDFRVATSVVVSHNVVAILPGARRPKEYVTFTAHWDAHGVGKPDATGDGVFHGAQDNASGTSMLIELGRYFARQPRPDRTLLFIALTGEEKGLLGSKYYSIAPLYPLERTAAEINMDGVLGAGRAHSISTLGESRNDLQPALGAIAKAHGRDLEPDLRPEMGLYYRTDHFPFARMGVPSLSIAPGSDLLAGGVEAGVAAKGEYLAHRYHHPADKYDATMDFGNMADDAALLAELARDVANAKTWPQWEASSDFKPLRDRSRAQRP